MCTDVLQYYYMYVLHYKFVTVCVQCVKICVHVLCNVYVM